MKTLAQCVLACFWGLRSLYLGYLHSRIMRIDPSHEEATRTMLERDRAQKRLAATWEMN